MARYQLLNPRGVHDTQAPAHDISPSDYTEWAAYNDWLAAGNTPDPAAPPAVVYATLAMQRAEMLARLDALHDEKRVRAIFVAAGNTWRLTPAFLALLTLCRLTTPPIPAGFTLPNATRAPVSLNNAQLTQVCEGARDKLLAIGNTYAVFVAGINASPAPLGINITIGWP